jgi:archaellum biogenesis ATPase FlaH
MVLETLTVAGFVELVGHLAEHLVGHIGHEKYQELTRHIWDRIPALSGLPANHDIACAVRLAQLQALNRVLREYEKSNPPEWQKDPVNKPEVFLDKARRFVRSQLPLVGEIEVAGAPGVKSAIEAGTKAIREALDEYRSGEGTVDKRLRRLAENAVLDELRDELVGIVLPEDFERRFRVAEPNAPGWFDLFSAYLAEQVKENDRFRRILLFDVLGDLKQFGLEQRDVLQALTEKVDAIHNLLFSEFKILKGYFGKALPTIQSEIRDYSFIIEDRTQCFVGRQSIFNEIECFVAKNPRGYVVIHGQPGIGKTALAAQLVKTKGYVHHFNSRSLGISKPSDFLTNICAQLIARYQLTDHQFTRKKASQNGGYLLELLNKISKQLRPGEKGVIVVDALDEVDIIDSAANVLYLSDTIPQGIFIVATVRSEAHKEDKTPRIPVNLSIKCETCYLHINHESKENEADIRKHLQQALTRPGIQKYIADQGINNEYFIELLCELSQGNFMYLHHVLPAIESGLYKDQKLKELPKGLQGYYESHWQIMRDRNNEEWFNYKLPIIMVLAAAEKPISIDLIEKFSGVQDRNRINRTLGKEEWGQFLYVDDTKTMIKANLYSLYHFTFREFLAKKDELEQGVNMMLYKLKIVDTITSELFGDRS